MAITEGNRTPRVASQPSAQIAESVRVVITLEAARIAHRTSNLNGPVQGRVQVDGFLRQRDEISGRLPADPAPTLITRRSAALTATSACLPRWSRSRSEAKIPRRAGITTSPGYRNLTARLTGPDLERRPVCCSSQRACRRFARSGRCGSHRGRTPPHGVSPYGRGSHRARAVSAARRPALSRRDKGA